MASTVTNLGEATDRDLLASYQRKRDQHAFATLVERYHSMVLGVAQRMLGCPHAAEDVLQATFLVLARDARKIRKRSSLASWLYGVSYRISARMVKRRARMQVSTLKDEIMVTDDPLEKLSEQFEHNAVFEELRRLPEHVRTPMILRYLQGQTNAEVAHSLALTESAVEGRLKRGRNQLRMRLARQGVTFAAVIVVLETTKEYAAASESPLLVAKTVEACLATGGTEVLGNEVIRLAEEEIIKMATTKVLSSVLLACATFGLVMAGWSMSGNGRALAQIPEQDPFGDVVVSPPQSQLDVEGTARETVEVRVTKTTPEQGSVQNSINTRLRDIGHYSVEHYEPTEIKILEKLQESTRLEFTDTPLSEVLEFLEDFHQLQIVVDERALDDVNVNATSDTVSADIKDIRLRNGLKLMLDDLELAAIIRNEVLLITSQEQAEEFLDNRVYKTDPDWHINSEQLLEIITTTVDSDTWSDVGGPSTILALQGGGLVISTTSEVHDKINRLLGQLDRLRDKRPAVSSP